MTIRNVRTVNTLYHKIRNKYYQKFNCAALFPIPTFIYLWAFYISIRSVRLICCSKIGGPIVENRSQIHECGNWERGRAVSCLEVHYINRILFAVLWNNHCEPFFCFLFEQCQCIQQLWDLAARKFVTRAPYNFEIVTSRLTWPSLASEEKHFSIII